MRLVLVFFLLHSIIILTDIVFPQEWIRRRFEQIGNPVQQHMTLLTYRTVRFGQFVGSLGHIYEENQRLREEIAAFRQQEQESIRLREENKRLREQLEMPEAVEAPVLAVSVVGIQSVADDQMLVLAAGTENGVESGMVVLAHGALVGRVVKSTSYRSYVRLITAPESKIPVYIDTGEEKQIEGVVEGVFHTHSRLVNFEPGELNVTEKSVYTSGVNGQFPRGILVGETGIQQPRTDRFTGSSFPERNLVLPWNYSNLHVVFVTLSL